MANINIHFDPSVTFTNVIGADGKLTGPTVSLRWDNVTAEDALQEVLDIHGLTLVHNPRTRISRVTRKPTLAPLMTSIVQLRYTNPTNMVELIKTTFSEPARSKVSADTRTSQLVIVTTERDMEAITNLLARLDIPSKQVLIEARLLETAKNPRSIKGIDWSGTLEGQRITFGNGFTSGTATTREGEANVTTLPSGRTTTSRGRETTRTDLTTLIGSGGISLDTMRGFHPATAFLNADGVSAVLSFLNSDNDTEVVATPRAVTLDNQMARLEVTRAFPIFQITPGSANSPAGAQVTYTNVGTILKVTPRISANDRIALKVVPEVSNIDSKDVQIVNGTRNEANVYAIRRIEADVVIPSGNTLVMGGLISDNSTKSHTKVPLLGDLPGVGLAFRRDTKARSKSNLIIFVTPTIVRDEDFQPTTTDFLHNKPLDPPDTEASAWDSGKPKQWFKKKSKD
jgi:type IV pilus assembly protein PilQ